jgi:hypothetical protein
MRQPVASSPDFGENWSTQGFSGQTVRQQVRVSGRGNQVRVRLSKRRHDMARISYDEQTAAAFKAVREVPRDGLSEWREAIRRHLHPSEAMTLADFLGQVDTFRQADTTMRNLTEDEFLRGKERLRRAVRHAEDAANPEARSNWLDLLVLR